MACSDNCTGGNVPLLRDLHDRTEGYSPRSAIWTLGSSDCERKTFAKNQGPTYNVVQTPNGGLLRRHRNHLRDLNMPTKKVHFADKPMTDHAAHVQNMTDTHNTNQKDKPDMTTTRSGRIVRPPGHVEK